MFSIYFYIELVYYNYMKLLTKEVLNKLEKNNSESDDPLCVVRFFNPSGAGTWYAISYDTANKLFFGYVSIFGDYNDELGYFSLDEIESFKGRYGQKIERDRFYSPEKLSVVKARSYK